jgi:SAM-dependent methyltransferase
MAEAAAQIGVPVVLGSGEALPFEDCTFGVVVAERVLQHVLRPEAVLDEMWRVLRPGGLLIAVDPIHAEAWIETGGLGALAKRLIAWRAEIGVTSPDAAVVAKDWATRRSGRTRIFVCSTDRYDEARVITNFPQWAGLARQAGESVTASEVKAWERAWGGAKSGHLPMTFSWPIGMTSATKDPQRV